MHYYFSIYTIYFICAFHTISSYFHLAYWIESRKNFSSLLNSMSHTLINHFKLIHVIIIKYLVHSIYIDQSDRCVGLRAFTSEITTWSKCWYAFYFILSSVLTSIAVFTVIFLSFFFFSFAIHISHCEKIRFACNFQWNTIILYWNFMIIFIGIELFI